MDAVAIADLDILLDRLYGLDPPLGSYFKNKTWPGEIKGDQGGEKGKNRGSTTDDRDLIPRCGQRSNIELSF
jgi:hypothetical protein